MMTGSGRLEVSDKMKKKPKPLDQGNGKNQSTQTTCSHHDDLFSRPYLFSIVDSISSSAGLFLVIFLTEHSGLSPHNFKEPGREIESPVTK